MVTLDDLDVAGPEAPSVFTAFSQVLDDTHPALVTPQLVAVLQRALDGVGYRLPLDIVLRSVPARVAAEQAINRLRARLGYQLWAAGADTTM